MKKKQNFNIDEEVVKQFDIYCKENGYKKSGIVEKFMREISSKTEIDNVEQFYNPNV